MSDLQLIEKFRDKVNANDFVLFKYRNVNGKDKWSCICSAMDWIAVAMEYIDDVKNGKRSCLQSMEVFAYIASIDVVWEAVTQLHRVFFDTKKIPFKNEYGCFEKKILEEDDNDYFKTLRASFGAHPVNLNGKEKGEKYFASWSGDSSGVYNVILYNNQAENDEFNTMYLKMNELNRFLEKRYGYLNKIMDEIDKQYVEFKMEMNNILIERNDNIFEQLIILKDASSKRLNLHNTLIHKLMMIFSVAITNKENEKMVNEYKEALKPLVYQIYKSLQTLEHDGVDYSVIYQTTNKLQNGYAYYIEKISNFIYGAGYPPILWESPLREIFKEHFVMEYSSYKELYILIIACISKLNKN